VSQSSRLPSAVPISRHKRHVPIHAHRPRPRILLDLAQTTYISSAGLRSVLQLVKHAASHGGRVGICSAPPHVMEVVEMSGFPSLLDIYADRAGAEAGTTI